VEGFGLMTGSGAVLETGPRRVLHAGCGKTPLPDLFLPCFETRLDIDPDNRPDVLASMSDLGNIGPFDLVYTSHALEHLNPFDAAKALKEFHRVLEPGGVAVVIVPDLEGVRPDNRILYESPGGAISGFDLIYGYRPNVAESEFMLHRCGFVADTLEEAFREAGFSIVETRRVAGYQLLATGVK